MRSAFSVTFNVVTMLSFLLTGIAIYGQERDWEIPFAWGVVLGCVWLAMLVRVAAMLAGVVTELRSGALKNEHR